MMGLSVVAVPTLGQESRENVRVRTVQGDVVAVNVKDSPNVIVVRVMMAGKKELIVGAVVDAKTAISRGAQHVRLEDLKVGESVVVTYVKRPDGLFAHSIQGR
jgi:hypothetical protein